MPTRLALRGFIHGGTRYKRHDPVTADAQTIEKMAATGLVGKDELHDYGETVPPEKSDTFLLEPGEKVVHPTSTTSKTAKPKAGKKSSASPAAQVSPPPTLPPLQPGVPPPLPDAK